MYGAGFMDRPAAAAAAAAAAARACVRCRPSVRVGWGTMNGGMPGISVNVSTLVTNMFSLRRASRVPPQPHQRRSTQAHSARNLVPSGSLEGALKPGSARQALPS